jgi:hypothetical protein
MAKQQKQKNSGVVAVRVKKAKTPAQLAKTAANVKAAQERFAQLQARQQAANEMRSMGYMGTDADLIEIRAAQAQAKLDQQYVIDVLAGPHGKRVSQFLGRRFRGSPTKVATVVRNYLKTQGLS